MEAQYEGPLSWRMVGDGKACRILLKNNHADATLTNIKIQDVSPNGVVFDYDQRPLIEFEVLSSLPPGTELPLHHRIMLEDIWDQVWTEARSDEWLIRLSEEYWKILEDESKRRKELFQTATDRRLKDDVLAEFLIDGSQSSQHLKVGAGSGLHLTPE